jgi:putative hydrolase of the HAD superfamily
MIRAVIFDYGNVISQVNTGDCAIEMEQMTGVSANIFRTVYDKYRFEFDRGTISGAEMYSQLLSDAGYHELSSNKTMMEKIAKLDLESWKNFNQDVTDWGLSLQKAGFKLGILSNMPYEFLDLYEKTIPLFTHADYACFSCRVKLIKPEPEIYKVALNGLGIKPEEAVFFDDIQINVDAARQLGINAFLWTGLDQGKKDWEQITKSK